VAASLLALAQPGPALNGAADPFVKADQVAAFKKEEQDAQVSYTFIDYPGAVHAFTNPAATENGKNNLPLAYDANADQKSCEECGNSRYRDARSASYLHGAS
jgi:dienelactone hydrolase